MKTENDSQNIDAKAASFLKRNWLKLAILAVVVVVGWMTVVGPAISKHSVNQEYNKMMKSKW